MPMRKRNRRAFQKKDAADPPPALTGNPQSVCVAANEEGGDALAENVRVQRRKARMPKVCMPKARMPRGMKHTFACIEGGCGHHGLLACSMQDVCSAIG